MCPVVYLVHLDPLLCLHVLSYGKPMRVIVELPLVIKTDHFFLIENLYLSFHL